MVAKWGPRVGDWGEEAGDMNLKSIGIVGAGIIGTVCANFLRRDGHAVTLFDRGQPGEEASFGNSGAFSPAGVAPVAMPGMVKQVPAWLLDEKGPLFIHWSQALRLAPWLIRFLRAGRLAEVRRISRALTDLNGETLDLMGPLVEEAGIAELIENKGGLYLYRSQAEFERDTLSRQLRREAGFNLEELSAGEIREAEPALAPDFERGLFLPQLGHTLNPHRLVSGLAAHLVRTGGQVTRHDVGAVQQLADDRARVVTAEGNHDFDLVVVAAGAWSQKLLAPLGYRIPLESQRGYHVMLPNPGVTLNSVIMPVASRVIVTPMELGLRLSGTVEFAGLERPPNYQRSTAILEICKTLIPNLNCADPAPWAGHRPCTPDSLPVLGRAPRHPNILFAFGHGHQGMMASPKTAQIITHLAADRTPLIDLTPFDARRFT